LSLFFSTPFLPPRPPSLFLYSPAHFVPFRSSLVFYCWATSQYCNVKHNTLPSRRNAPPWRRRRA
jgi:hypothetical protein